jgi:hypothetical protein
MYLITYIDVAVVSIVGIVVVINRHSVLNLNLLQMDKREGDKKSVLRETGFSSRTCVMLDNKVNL